MPAYTSRRELWDRILVLRRQCALDIMRETEQFLDREATRLAGIAASHMTTVERLVQQEYGHDEDKATASINKAKQVIKATSERERVKEHRHLEERSRSLSLKRPSDGDIADPVNNLQRQLAPGGRGEDDHPFRGRPNRGGRRGRGRRPGRRARGPPNA